MKRKSPFKVSALFLTLAFALVFAVGSPAYAANITLKIDGVTVTPTVAPIVENGTTLVPLRFISENLGAEVDWDQSSKKATVKTAGYTVVFTIDSKSYTVNGQTKTLAVAPSVVNGSTMLPIRAFAESIGAEVNYNSATNTADINYFTTMTGTLKLTGSTTLQPIAQAAADKLTAMNTGLSISVAGGGSGTGVNDTIAGTNNLGMSSRELTDDESSQIIPIAVASDGIAIIVHPGNKVKGLTKEQAADIFLGNIKNWSEVGGDNAPILVQTRETGSGTRSTLEEMLLKKESVVATATPHTSSQLIKQAVAREANAIGFDSIGFVDSTVSALSLEGVAASAATVNNNSYAMGRSLFILSKTTPTGNSAKFIDYLKTADCQKNIVEKEGYIALN
jgi:phosphate transport system substrate-binding protein